METIAQGAVAGLIAALVTTIILGLAKYALQRFANRQDVKYIRALLTQGRRRVMAAEDTVNKDMGTLIPADVLRAAQYNNMIREVGVALEKWTVNLNHGQRTDLYDALDWYHTDGLYATMKEGKVMFTELPEGIWPTVEMSSEAASNKFGRLQTVEWLKLKVNKITVQY